MPVRTASALRELFRTAPFSADQDLRLVTARRGRAAVSLRLGRRHMQGLGRAHGGVITALADTAATFAAYATVDAEEALLTASLAVSLLRGPEEGDRLTASARVVHAGRRTVVAEADVTDARGRHVAASIFTMMRVAREAGTAVSRPGTRSRPWRAARAGSRRGDRRAS